MKLKESKKRFLEIQSKLSQSMITILGVTNNQHNLIEIKTNRIKILTEKLFNVRGKLAKECCELLDFFADVYGSYTITSEGLDFYYDDDIEIHTSYVENINLLMQEQNDIENELNCPS